MPFFLMYKLIFAAFILDKARESVMTTLLGSGKEK